MSKGNTFENDFLKLILQATAIANLADNAAASPLTSLYFALHTADPGEAGDQTTNEVGTGAYVNYARVAILRSASGWTITGNVANPVANVDFPAAGAGTTASLTHWSLGTAASGAGKVLWKGPITPTLSITVGSTPRLTSASQISED